MLRTILVIFILWIPSMASAIDSDQLQMLVVQAKNLAEKDVIMPIEEIRLAAQLAELAGSEPKSQEVVIAAVRTELWNHENFHVRRVAVNSVRRIGRFDSAGLLEALIAKLEDPHAWVRYDAAWTIETAGLRNTDSISGLKKLAAGTHAPSPEERAKLNKSDATLMSGIRAAEALKKLGVE